MEFDRVARCLSIDSSFAQRALAGKKPICRTVGLWSMQHAGRLVVKGASPNALDPAKSNAEKVKSMLGLLTFVFANSVKSFVIFSVGLHELSTVPDGQRLKL